jgi:two-component system LytT family sensor kinase
MRINHNGTILEEDISHALSPHIFVALGFMIALFYSDVFWLLKKALRYKSVLIRVILPLAWFGIVFLANTYTDALLTPQQRTDTELLPPPPNGQRTVMDKETDHVESPADHPDDVRINFRRPDTMKLRGVVSADNVQREVARQQTKAFIFAADGFSNTLFFIFMIVFGLSIAYFFLKEWGRVEKMRSDLAAVQLDTEVKFLKSQVNPHFLFNTLNNLFSMAQKKGNEDLADGISKLSGMMRYMIYESNEEFVPLKKEIEYLEDCIVLNKLRYADNEAIVRFDFPSDTSGVNVAPMLFIPFVENAFKHGVLIGESSEIDISIAIVNKQLSFSCTNTIYSVKKMEHEKGGIGLENVKRRLDLLYPGKHVLATKTDDNKYIVTLGITIG